jgi:hypothetical protein
VENKNAADHGSAAETFGGSLLGAKNDTSRLTGGMIQYNELH